MIADVLKSHFCFVAIRYWSGCLSLTLISHAAPQHRPGNAISTIFLR